MAGGGQQRSVKTQELGSKNFNSSCGKRGGLTLIWSHVPPQQSKQGLLNYSVAVMLFLKHIFMKSSKAQQTGPERKLYSLAYYDVTSLTPKGRCKYVHISGHNAESFPPFQTIKSN